MGYDKTKLSETLKKVFAFTSFSPEPRQTDGPRHILPGGGTTIRFQSAAGETAESRIPDSVGPTVTVVDDGVFAISEFARELLGDPEFESTIGEKAIRSKVDSLLRARAKGDTREPSPEFIRFEVLKPLKEQVQQWTAYAPIINLTLESEFQIGDFQFFPAAKVKSTVEQFVAGHQFAGDTVESQAYQREVCLGFFKEALPVAASWLSFPLRAHPLILEDLIPSRASYGLNFIRCFRSIIFGEDKRSIFGLPSEVQYFRWPTFAFDTGANHSMRMNSLVGGALLLCKLDKDVLNFLNERCHFTSIQALIAKGVKERSTLESSIVQAMQSWGKTVLSFNKDDALLGYTIVLERMLIKTGEISTTEKFSERLALYLGETPEMRKQIVAEAKRLYDLRSRIVHAAYSGATTEDVAIMEGWATTVVLATIGNLADYPTHEVFCQKLEDRKFGA